MKRVFSQPSAPDRAASLVLLALVVLLPLFPPETRGESMAGCAALIVLLAALAWRRAAPAARWLVLGAAAAVGAALAADAPGSAVEPIAVWLLAAAAGVSVAALPRTTRRIELVPSLFAVVGGVLGLGAVYEKLWGLSARAARLAADPAFADREAVLARLAEGRAFEPFATPAALGGFFALCLPVTVAFALSRRGRWRVLLATLAGAQVAGLVTAASATALGGLLAATIVLGVTHGRRRKPLLLAAMLVLVVLGVVAAIRGERLWSAAEPDSPWRLRAGNFRIAASIVGEHPWLGVGPGGYAEAYPRYRRPDDNEARHAHDLPLELAAETGLPAGAVLSALFLVLFLGPLLHRRPDEAAWVHGLAVGLGSFALQNLADFTAFFPSMLWLAAVLRGVLGARRRRPAAAKGHPVACGVALASTLAAAVVAGLAGLASDTRLVARHATFDRQPEAALQHTQRATRLAPWNPDGWIQRAQAVLLAHGRSRADAPELSTAQGFAERAVRLSPVRPEARRLRGAIRAASGDAPGAYADLVEAARLYPARLDYARERDRLADALSGARSRGGERP